MVQPVPRGSEDKGPAALSDDTNTKGRNILLIDPLHKWRLNLNNNTLCILIRAHVFRQRIFHMNVRLRMYKYCYSTLGAIYAKVYVIQYI